MGEIEREPTPGSRVCQTRESLRLEPRLPGSIGADVCGCRLALDVWSFAATKGVSLAADVELASEDSVVRGRLFKPSVMGPTPGMVMAPGFSVTSRFPVFERYAEALAEVGVTTLLFDYRGFGMSEGEPRQEVNPWEQARDYRAAIEFLRNLTHVDGSRVGVWGVSTSCSVACVVAATDPSIAAVVLQVPAIGDALSPPDPDSSVFNAIRETVTTTDLASLDRTIVGPLPVVSADQLNSPSFVTTITAFRWFIENGARFGTGWSNQATVARLSTTAPFDAQVCIPHIKAPLLMIVAHEDEENDADLSRAVFGTANEPKQLITVDGGHFGVLYPDTPEFEQSASAQQAFLREHLAV